MIPGVSGVGETTSKLNLVGCDGIYDHSSRKGRKLKGPEKRSFKTSREVLLQVLSKKAGLFITVSGIIQTGPPSPPLCSQELLICNIRECQDGKGTT